MYGFFFKLYISNQMKNTTEKKKLFKTEMNDLSDERNLDKSKVLSV